MKKVFYLTALCSLGMAAQETGPNFDGPYVFQREGKTIVKQIIDGVYKDVSADYAKTKTLSCKFPNNVSFSFPLKASITTDVAENNKLPTDFLAISDFEGEFDALATLLKKAKVINNNYQWIYGKKHLFIVGDMVDRGTSVTEVLWLIYKLEDEAKAAGGAVHYVLGNHEIINLNGDVRYVDAKYLDPTTGSIPRMGETIKTVYGSDSELGRWLRSKNVIERHGDVAFVHGGITKIIAEYSDFPYSKYNDYARHYFGNGGKCTFASAQENDRCKAINTGTSSGLYWDRSVAKGQVSQEDLNASLNAMLVKRMVIGHSEVVDANGKDRIRAHDTYGDKVLNLDIDHHSFGTSKTEQALLYKNGCYHNFTTTEKVAESITEIACPVQSLSVGDIKASKQVLLLSPNPVKNSLNIQLPDLQYDAMLHLYDMQGSLLKSQHINADQTKLILDLSTLQNGYYQIQILNKALNISQKLIKQG